MYMYMSSFIATKNELELVNLQEKNSQEYSFLHNVLLACLFVCFSGKLLTQLNPVYGAKQRQT